METIPVTFEDFDQFGLSSFGERLTKFIEIDRHFVDGAFILCLGGSFGSGKSTFFKMWRLQIGKTDPLPFHTMILNAWDADFLRDPLLSIISAFLSHFEDLQGDWARTSRPRLDPTRERIQPRGICEIVHAEKFPKWSITLRGFRDIVPRSILNG